MTAQSLLVERAELDAIRRFGPTAALACGCAAAAVLPLSSDDGPVLCPFRLATGGWCPGCGATRAFRAMMHGDFAAAYVLNPWAMLVLTQFVVFTSWRASAPNTFEPWWERRSNVVLIANIVVAISVWVARMALDQIPIAFT